MQSGPYGVLESNPLPKGYHSELPVEALDWTSSRLAKIERMRFLSDPGFPVWDVSYCTGRNTDGKKVTVRLPFDQLPKGKGRFWPAMYKFAKRDGVDLRKLRVFQAISKLV